MSEAWKYAFAMEAPIAGVLRQLERPLDVLARRHVVARAAVTPRAPLQDVGSQRVAR